MTGPLARYLRRMLLLQTLGMLVALTALLQVLDLLDATSDILRRHLGVAGLLHYTALRTPAEAALALPLAMLIGALFTFYTLARHQEIVAIRSAGIRLGWVLRAMLPVALLLAVAQFVATDRLVPASEAALAAWWGETAPPGDDQAPAKGLWLHTGDGLLSLQKMSRDGHHLQGLRIYSRGADGQFAGRIVADAADWDGERWQLSNASELRLEPGGVQRSVAARSSWASALHPRDLVRVESEQPHLSSTVLIRVLAGQSVAVRPDSYYRTALYRKFIAPLGIVVMLLLALPATQAAGRGGAGGNALMLALGAGLAFVLLDGLLGSLGEGGRLPPLAAAIGAPLLFGSLGFWLLSHCERT